MKFKGLLIVMMSVGIASCGGSSDSTNVPSTTTPNPGSQAGGTVLNSTFEGSLFQDDANGYYDIKTGQFAAIAPDDIDHAISPSKDGIEYVETIEDFSKVTGSFRSNDAIIIRNMQTGLTVDSFEISEDIIGPAKLSPNREFIAAIWEDESNSESDDQLTIFNRSGQVVSRSQQQNIYGFDWLADGRLVFASLNDNSIYLSNSAHSATASLLKGFDSTARPGWLAVSPDGNKIAFELVTEFSGSPTSSWRFANVWTMNIDGSDLRQVAKDDRNKPLINTPVWAPDSQWLGVLEGSLSSIAFVPDPIRSDEEYATVSGVAGAMFAVKADSDKAFVPANNELVKPLFRLADDNTKRFLRTSYDSSLQWLAPISDLPVVKGSLPAGNNARHRGITGAIYINNDGINGEDVTNVYVFDLASGSVSTQFLLTDDDTDRVRDLVYVSADKQWVSHYAYESRDTTIRVYSRAGELQKIIPLSNADNTIKVTNRVQFSPINSDLLLFSYEYFDQTRDNKILVYNWREGRIVKAFLANQYVGSEWTADGNLLLTARDSGNVYQALAVNDSYEEPTLLFSLPDPVKDIVLSPTNDRVALELVGGIWTAKLDGTDLKRVTARGDGFYGNPEWSPDGKYIAFKSFATDDESTDLGALWIVAADAENVAVNYPFNSPDAIPVMDAAGKQLSIFGTYSWR